MNTAISLFVFKRPDTTEKVFEAIRQLRPSKLLVIADGPRYDRPEEADKCIATRKIIEKVDWECDVIKNYSEINLGCAERVSSGLDWVFSIVEEAIILEDDCVPHPTFFRYCDELLEYYRHDERIMSVCGLSVPAQFMRDDFSYCFSQYQRCWGWATWRRAWQHYDHKMTLWPIVVENKMLGELLLERQAVNFWHKKFQEVYEHRIDSWAYRWMFACWMQSGFSLLPNVNLISNIGFTSDATHTVNDKFAAQLSRQEMIFPLRHPPFVIRDGRADSFIQNTRHSAGLLYKVKTKTKRLLQP